ncbi:MAG TPA: tRNA 2-thiouridine(34) synthase MnmA [Gammaproteobacteria bacterium]|jgi:tRNA-specific 2-thiouridylase|nr:tRNA 2-thiouridine(34) synthase MnmA [Gammaproteobacteria bacterium]
MASPSSTRVIVGLSGGVDSAVAALLLKREGHAVEGLFMDNWEDGEDESYCTAAEDFQDARQVCETLGIPLHKVNFAAEYRERVFNHFLEGYAAGWTPNPDVLCNSEIKFKAFLDHALRLGAGHIATGHYARLAPGPAGVKLLKALDGAKDQSYFLHAVTQAALQRALFPLGGLLKTDTRALAKEAGFANHAKKDSTGICFIGERRFSEFLGKYLPAQPGEIVTPDGKVLGRHNGLMFYTLGQRSGIGIGGRREGTDEPWYVAGKDMARNRLLVVQGHDHPLLLSDGLTAGRLHWIAGAAPALPLHCAAKTRYRQVDQPCTLVRIADGRARVEFEQPQRAVTPGQYAVFYAGDECLGGGVIEAPPQPADAPHVAAVELSRA